MEDSYTAFDTLERQRLIDKPAKDRISARCVLSILAFFGLLVSYSMQINLGAGIRSMTNWTSSDLDLWDGRCLDAGNVTDKHHVGEFNWNDRTQILVQRCFFCGYIVTQVPGGWLATRKGAKHVIGMVILLTAVMNIVTPVLTRVSVYLLMVVRIVEGLCQGALYPAVHALWGKWSPKWERGRWTSLTYAGAMLGAMVTWSISDPLADVSENGWVWIYYITGCLACLWVIVWALLARSTPGDHPRISNEERKYIQDTTGTTQNLPIPWRSIMTSPTFGSICVCHFCGSWTFHTMVIYLPRYLSTIHNIDVRQTGWWSALPYLALSITMVLVGCLSDVMRSRRCLSTASTRKMMTTIGMLVPSSLLIVCVYLGCEDRWVIGLLMVAFAMYGFVYGGFYINHLDIAPRFAGVLMGVSGCFGAMPGLLVPVFVEFLSDVSHSQSTWRTVFLINGCLSVFACLVYIFLGAGEELPWARPPDDRRSKDKRRWDKRVDKWMVDSADLG